MYFRLVKAELIKLHRSPVWLAFLVLPVIPALLGTLNYLGNIEILQSEWYSLWTQHTLFTDYIFLPVLIGVYCAYTMYMEQREHGWNKLLSVPARKSAVYAAKLTVAAVMIFVSEVWIAALYVASGRIAGLTSAPPWGEMAVWCACGTLGGAVMASIQLTVSFFLRGFALPVAVSLGGGLSGLYFLARKLGSIWPYSLMAYGMSSNAPQQISESGYLPFVLTCAGYIVLFAVISGVIMTRRDV